MTFQRFAKRYPGYRPARGYLAKCPRCGSKVIHGAKTGLPLSSHWYSSKCREALLQKKLPIE